MACLQVSLGISTLVYLVPVPLAAAHQAGSLILLTLAVAAGASLRMPGKAAQKYLDLARRTKMAQGVQLKTRPLVMQEKGKDIDGFVAKAPIVSA